MDRPMTLSEYSNWQQMICVESANCARASAQLTRRVEKAATLKETLQNKIQEGNRTINQLDQEIGEMEKTIKPVQDCITEAETKLAALVEENERLKARLAELEAPVEKVSCTEDTSEGLRGMLEKECAKLAFLKRCLVQCLTPDNVWDALPSLLARDKLKEVVKAATGDLSVWHELLKED
ncbi:uncharacterized protein LOC129762767 [Toxorhynchites rutilus septentrionalis]|uniref:uncharacterized protein LOC129762767 n=1 Tax=Toxorhynchites rutilus septentrionalis TaxID=329112 RepID=UPI00247B052A|nr:uncharacterized protein LOC129762767 [Toxorhynchites rutilus septentrionalis]